MPGMARYGRIWPDMARYGQIWPDMSRYGQIWPDVAIRLYLAMKRGFVFQTAADARIS